MTRQATKKSKTESIVSEIRRIREEISNEFDNDVWKLEAHLRELERQHPERLVGKVRRSRRRTG